MTRPDDPSDAHAVDGVDDTEEALTWGDEHDASHVDAPAAEPRRVAFAPGVSGAALVGYGAFAGVYVLEMVAWALTMVTGFVPVDGILNALMYRFGQLLAIVGPAVWALAVYRALRGSGHGTRMLWLMFGAVVFIPWPFILR